MIISDLLYYTIAIANINRSYNNMCTDCNYLYTWFLFIIFVEVLHLRQYNRQEQWLLLLLEVQTQTLELHLNCCPFPTRSLFDSHSSTTLSLSTLIYQSMGPSSPSTSRDRSWETASYPDVVIFHRLQDWRSSSSLTRTPSVSCVSCVSWTFEVLRQAFHSRLATKTTLQIISSAFPSIKVRRMLLPT